MESMSRIPSLVLWEDASISLFALRLLCKLQFWFLFHFPLPFEE